MKAVYNVSILGAIMLVLISMSSCGGGGVSYTSPADSSPQPAVQLESESVIESPGRQISMETALEDLESLQTPPGVDPVFFASLKGAFRDVLYDLYDENGNPTGKAASALSLPEMTRAWVLCGKTVGAKVTVTWRGRHTGDYDLNSEVNVSDITPLGLKFNCLPSYDEEGLAIQSGTNEADAQVDGDINGEINISDLVPIALNFGSAMLGYRVYLGHSADGAEFTWLPDFIAGPDDNRISVPFNTSSKQGEVLHYSFTFDRPVIPEGEKLYAKIVPFDGTSEGMETIMPVYDGPHAIFECTTCHTKVAQTFLGQENTCDMCHATPPEGGVDWAQAPVMHQMCSNCHESHAFSVTPPESACTACHSGIAADLADSKMTACLDCHATPHVPNATPGTETCSSCHAGQATALETSSMQECSMCHSDHTFVLSDARETCSSCHETPPEDDTYSWDMAPGDHSSCELCHNNHSFMPADYNGLCTTCHDSVVSEGHAGGEENCKSCHTTPHIPDMDVTGVDCLECHPNPPEDLQRQWDEAPGLHDNCDLCHTGTKHGNKPEPPESICGDCHGSLISNGHGDVGKTCLECHVFPHLPESNMSGVTCMECHPTPPESSRMTWDDVPHPAHKQCENCHRVDEHPVNPDSQAAQELCILCHAAYADESSHGWVTCLDCHRVPHVPDMNWNCSPCHPY